MKVNYIRCKKSLQYSILDIVQIIICLKGLYMLILAQTQL